MSPLKINDVNKAAKLVQNPDRLSWEPVRDDKTKSEGKLPNQSQ